MPALSGSSCPSCCDSFYPQRASCPRCGNADLATCTFSGRGDVYSYTTVNEAPAQCATPPPYMVALVHLSEGPYVTAQLAGMAADAVFIGLPVEVDGGSDCLTFRARQSLVE